MNDSTSYSGSASRLMKDVLQSWKFYFTSILATIAYLLMDFYMRKMIGRVADDILDHKETFMMSFLLLLGSTFLASPFHGLATYTKGRMSEEVMLRLRLVIGKKTTKLRMPYLETHDSGTIISHLGSEMDMLNGFTYYGLSMVTTLFVQLIGVTAFMLSVDVEITIVFISLSLVVLPLSILMTKQVRAHERVYRSQLAQSQQRAKEGIHFIALIKSFRLERKVYAQYEQAVQQSTDAAIKNGRTIAYVAAAGKAIGFIPLITVIALGVWRISKGTLSQGELLSLVTIGGGFFGWLQDTPDIVAYLRKTQVACERIYGYLALPEEEDGSGSEPDRDGSCIVKLEEVHFAYPGEKEVLQGVSLEIRKGESVAIVGASGSGKSTLMKLICGFVEPSSGCVELMGHTTDAWEKEAMRRHIAFVSQKNQLFPGTLRDNLLPGQFKMEDERLADLCREAGLESLLADRGLDKHVGEAEIELSGGEKQRITILRALLKDAELILLDEPTSALDAVSEEKVQTCLQLLTEGKTSLTIAHRMATIQKADRIYVLHQGRIVQVGAHDELILEEGPYLEMLKLQSFKDRPEVMQWS
ncbi:ABC transporter ATP-binding protein [Paenibacillus sp. R14(2021)]|uniref:ABC transporter ATP-binding protein n=1 Tax=Paenibacillus sp. R14(2021) TaxID=2859228 RepID=UPI001C61430A|nr:ABC transporter ATP-binding protein [Paenibacillus sp. R14(2021)]